MKKIVRLSVLVLCAALLCATLLTARAETKFFNLSVNSVTAEGGDRVCFAVDIENNPGIMAMTVTFHYDPSVLQFVGYVPGLIKKDTVKDHPERGYISIVWCGDPKRNPDGTISDHPDMEADGTLFGMEFDVAEKAAAGSYPVTVKKIRPDEPGDSLLGSFANWGKDSLKPTVSASALIIPGQEIVCTAHQFAAWKTLVEDDAGKQNTREERICAVCGYTEYREVPPKKQNKSENDASTSPEKPGDSKTADPESELTVSDPLKPREDPQDGGNRPSVETAPEQPDDEIPQTAEDLIDRAQQSPSRLAQVFSYLFGTAEHRGLFQVLGQFFKTVFT